MVLNAQPKPPGFVAKNNNSFQLTFENGLSISMCWGPGCYCERYSFGTDPALDLGREPVFSPDAEVAISQAGVLMNWGLDTVSGGMRPDQVGLIIGIVQAAESLPSSAQRLAELGLAPEVIYSGPLETVRRKLVELGLAIDPVRGDDELEFNP